MIKYKKRRIHGKKFTIGRNREDVTIIDLDTGNEVSRPDIAEQFLDTVDKAITAAGGVVEELPESGPSHLHVIDGEGAEVVQLFPDQE